MKNRKFYHFVKEVAGEDKALAECIITAHKLIFKDEQAIEEGLGSKIAAGAGLLGLGLGSAGAKDISKQDLFKIFSDSDKNVVQVSPEVGGALSDFVNDLEPAVKSKVDDLVKQYGKKVIAEINAKQKDTKKIGKTFDTKVPAWDEAEGMFDKMLTKDVAAAHYFQSQLQGFVKAGTDDLGASSYELPPFQKVQIDSADTGDSPKLDEEEVMRLAKKYKLSPEEAKKLLIAQSEG